MSQVTIYWDGMYKFGIFFMVLVVTILSVIVLLKLIKAMNRMNKIIDDNEENVTKLLTVLPDTIERIGAATDAVTETTGKAGDIIESFVPSNESGGVIDVVRVIGDVIKTVMGFIKDR